MVSLRQLRVGERDRRRVADARERVRDVRRHTEQRSLGLGVKHAGTAASAERELEHQAVRAAGRHEPSFPELACDDVEHLRVLRLRPSSSILKVGPISCQGVGQQLRLSNPVSECELLSHGP